MPWRHIGEWRYSSTIFDLGTRWKGGVRFKPRPLQPRGKSTRYPLHRVLGRPQSRYGRYEVIVYIMTLNYQYRNRFQKLIIAWWLGWTIGKTGFHFRQGHRPFSSPQPSDRLQDEPSISSNGHRRLSPQNKSGRWLPTSIHGTVPL
jgi:hypothetical protein